MTDYLQQAGLELTAALAAAQQALAAALTVPAAANYPDLYRYPVPKLGEGGSCSLIDELEAEPWDIAPQFGGASPQLAQQLLALQALLDAVLAQVPADWLGVYCRLPRPEADVLLEPRLPRPAQPRRIPAERGVCRGQQQQQGWPQRSRRGDRRCAAMAARGRCLLRVRPQGTQRGVPAGV